MFSRKRKVSIIQSSNSLSEFYRIRGKNSVFSYICNRTIKKVIHWWFYKIFNHEKYKINSSEKKQNRNNAINRIIFILERNNYHLNSKLGPGTFGTDVEVINSSTGNAVVVKIVLEKWFT